MFLNSINNYKSLGGLNVVDFNHWIRLFFNFSSIFKYVFQKMFKSFGL